MVITIDIDLVGTIGGTTMGFWKKLFGGSNQPDGSESVGVDPTTGKKMKPAAKGHPSGTEGAKYSGRTEDTKAQKRADPETREISQDAENYPQEAEPLKTKPRAGVEASAKVGKGEAQKSAAEKKKTQPKPASKQRTTPKEAQPGTPKPEAGQHQRKD